MLFLCSLIAGLLLLATITVERYLQQNNTPEAYQNRRRIRSWWLIFAICTPVFIAGGWWLKVFILLLALRAAHEAFALFHRPLKRQHLCLIIVGGLLLGFIPFRVITDWSMLFWVPIGLLLGNVVGTLYGYTSLALTMGAIFTSLVSLILIGQQQNGDYLLLLLFFLTAGNDVFQYLGGKRFGKHRLAPTISPNKTIQGSLVGLLATMILSLSFFTQTLTMSLSAGLLAGVFLGIAGIIGDLHISILKRRAGVKDSGDWIPGHGGLLDRADSLLLTAPVFGCTMAALIPGK